MTEAPVSLDQINPTLASHHREFKGFLAHAIEHDKQLCDPTIPIVGEPQDMFQELKGTRKIVFSLMLDLGLLPHKYK